MLKEVFLNLMVRYSDDKKYSLECWAEIEKNYSQKSRCYHNLTHLNNMLVELNEVKSNVKELDTLLFALFYHDIIYKSTKQDNEPKSALFFESRISKTSFPFIKECMNQIELTKEHKYAADFDTNIFLDLDLSVLGKSREEYIQYFKNIRKEYKIYPDFLYYKGRKKALLHLLNAETIFKTKHFISKYEQKAKENLEFELNQL